jgi:hypothetical protein
MPLRPLLEVLTFWMLLALGGLFVTMDAMQLYAGFALGVTLDTPEIAVMAVMGVLAPICFWIALVFWFRLKR